jgi:uncharacterized protein (TIGR00255 family)
MTGFGRGETSAHGRRFTVELRAVNHRYLDVRVRLPGELAEHTPAAEAIAKSALSRGRVEINGRLDAGSRGPSPVLDAERARAAFAALVSLRDELAPGEPVPLGLLSSVPDLFKSAPTLGSEEAKGLVTQAVRAACDDLDAMRLREGAALGVDFAARLGSMREHIDSVHGRMDNLVAVHRDRLRERIEKLLDGAAALDPGRLEQEIAILADKSDITEELTRLQSHFDQFATLAGADEAQVGRKLDFLVQEMNREVNTIGSKSADAELAHTVVAMKAEIERIREQVQNVL